jgi:Helix-turn-helix domain
MSVRVMANAWELALSPTEKLVILALADCADDKGICWPSIATIARKSNLGERSVQRSIQALAAAGHLSRNEVIGKGCKYTIHPRHGDTPATKSPVPHSRKPPPQRHPTPATVAPKPSKNHQEPPLEPNGSVVSSETPLTANELVDEWNDLATELGLPLVAKLTDARRRRANARLRQYPELQIWQRAFANIRASPLCRGDNARGWRADFDFLLQDRSFTKLIEGSYGQT